MNAPDFVVELAKARLKARVAKDFAASDKLRSEINQAGYEVLDVADGYELREKTPYATFQSIRQLKSIDSKEQVTVAIIVDGFTEDAVLAIASIKKHSKCAIAILCIGDPGGLVHEMAGGFSPRAIYYRNADIEFSLKLRHANGRLLQMDLPLIQGRHHGYHDVELEYRDLQSKKNYDRILERFRGKSAILSPRR